MVVGSGPNGLAAAVVLARAGWSVLVLEGRETIGGGTRTAELTLPGFRHDVCSAVHPMAVGSPFFRELGLDGSIDWLYPEVDLAHPMDDGTAGVAVRSLEETADGLGPQDGPAWRGLMAPLAEAWESLAPDLLAPLGLPGSPLRMARFGLAALRSAEGLARARFRGERARALFAGIAAHGVLPLDRPVSAAAAMLLGAAAHAVGWPFPRGGAQTIADALAERFRALGGVVETGRRVRSLADVPPSRAVLFDLTPRQLLRIAGEALPVGYRKKLVDFRYGPGVFKVDWALSEPVPWRAEACRRAGTLHLGGTLSEIAAGEEAVWEGRPAERPFVLVAQPTVLDPSRAPEGKHVAWGYCHVPNGSTADRTEAVEAQMERFAPGFRDVVLARSTMDTAAMEGYNPNYVGGDINGGVQDLGQLFARPVARVVPYSTPNPRVWICSSSSPPGGGVHGMCGYHAARAVLAKLG